MYNIVGNIFNLQQPILRLAESSSEKPFLYMSNSLKSNIQNFSHIKLIPSQVLMLPNCQRSPLQWPVHRFNFTTDGCMTKIEVLKVQSLINCPLKKMYSSPHLPPRPTTLSSPTLPTKLHSVKKSSEIFPHHQDTKFFALLTRSIFWSPFSDQINKPEKVAQ